MHNINRISPADSEYPNRLRAAIPDDPPKLFIQGSVELNAERTLAIVGTRSPFYKATEIAHMMARIAAAAGYVIVSGYATGIDTCGHIGAMDAGAPTIAVLGSGINRKLPTKPSLEQYVLSHGLFVSEQDSPDTPREYEHLMARDRITSGLSDIVVVVETDARGGAVHTAELARAQGRKAVAIEWTGNKKYCDKAQAGTTYMISSGIADAVPILDAGDEFADALQCLLKADC